MFLDEVTFRVATRSGTRHLVRRPAGTLERYKAKYTRPKVGISEAINVWAAFCSNDRCTLVILPKKKTMKQEIFIEIMRRFGIPFMQRNNLHSLLMDKAPYHQSLLTQTFLDDNNIRRITWAGNSPDLNRFELLVFS